MTGSAKQSIARHRELDCFVAVLLAMRWTISNTPPRSRGAMRPSFCRICSWQRVPVSAQGGHPPNAYVGQVPISEVKTSYLRENAAFRVMNGCLDDPRSLPRWLEDLFRLYPIFLNNR